RRPPLSPPLHLIKNNHKSGVPHETESPCAVAGAGGWPAAVWLWRGVRNRPGGNCRSGTAADLSLEAGHHLAEELPRPGGGAGKLRQGGERDEQWPPADQGVWRQ